LVGNVHAAKVFIPATTTTFNSDVCWRFNESPFTSDSLELRDATQSLVINLNGATVIGGSVICTVEWTEE
jgi:hypothetical protein